MQKAICRNHTVIHVRTQTPTTDTAICNVVHGLTAAGKQMKQQALKQTNKQKQPYIHDGNFRNCRRMQILPYKQISEQLVLSCAGLLAYISSNKSGTTFVYFNL